jgi:hypothetical protein
LFEAAGARALQGDDVGVAGKEGLVFEVGQGEFAGILYEAV